MLRAIVIGLLYTQATTNFLLSQDAVPQDPNQALAVQADAGKPKVLSKAMPELSQKIKESLAPAKIAKTTATQTDALRNASDSLKAWLTDQRWNFTANVANVRHDGTELDGTPRYIADLVPPSALKKLPANVKNTREGGVAQFRLSVVVSEELGKSLLPADAHLKRNKPPSRGSDFGKVV